MGSRLTPKSTGARRAHSVKPPSKPRRQPAVPPLPDLQSILGRFDAALALVAVAHIAMQASHQLLQEELALRQGVAALNAVYNALDRAELQIARAAGGAR